MIHNATQYQLHLIHEKARCNNCFSESGLFIYLFFFFVFREIHTSSGHCKIPMAVYPCHFPVIISMEHIKKPVLGDQIHNLV